MKNAERAEQLLQSVTNAVKNTISYYESPDKKEFEKGAKMFRDKIKIDIIRLYEDLIDNQKRSDEKIARINKTIQDFKNLFEGV